MKKTILSLSLVIVILPFSLATATASHIVISEIKLSGGTGKTTDEFVELYNPTGSAVSLSGWSLVKKTASGSDYVLVDDFGTKTIPANGFFLITHPSGYTGTTVPDSMYTTTNSLSDNNTVILLDGTQVAIDQVGFGTATIFEGMVAANPAALKSLERKAKPDSTVALMAEGGRDLFAGNGEETDNNGNDFLTRDAPEPQNSVSELEFLTAAPPTAPTNTNTQSPVPTTTTAQNRPPVAEVTVASKAAKVRQDISFSGADSSDPDGDKLTFAWDFGDAKTGSGKEIRHAFAKPGEYIVSLIAKDGMGNEAHTSVTISVAEYEYSTRVFINEVLPSCAGSDEACEFIELVNTDTRPLQLDGWIVTDQKVNYHFAKEAAIKPNGFMVLKQAETKITLNNSGDTIYLVDPAGKIVHGVTYGKATDDQSFARTADGNGWRWTEAVTPARANEFSEDEERSIGQTIEDSPQMVARATGTETTTNSARVADAPLVMKIVDVTEAMVGQLVTVTAEAESVSGRNVYLVDEAGNTLRVYIPKKPGLETVGIKAGETVTITGEISKTSAGLRIVPRQAADIRVLGKETVAQPSGTVLGGAVEMNPAGGDQPTDSNNLTTVILVGTVVLAAGLIGWRVYQARQTKKVGTDLPKK